MSFLDVDPWLYEYECCEKLYRDIMELLTQREKYPRISDNYSKASAVVRLRLKQYNEEVSQLHLKLENKSGTGSITPAEFERRTRQIETLHSKSIQMKKIFDEQVVSKSQEDRKDLIGFGTANLDGPSTSYSVNDLKEAQKRMIGQQNEGLENLSKIISRQKDIATTITNEVDYHNDLLDDLGNQMDHTDTILGTATRHIEVVDRKDKTCVYWVIIILLFISIVTVSAI
ncbi:syntaxin-8 [Diabrotica virgifera virgifera]|uniref:t-SNARE coiled-coil homology domain-containing protein n=1 Tax=Diabrotica virgifera virgifera TaxID=50390 RepID=A0ABM5KWZ9_DIAVI|nr:syntaxin-8 [Diabrotica virgifera virgifera]